MAEEIVVKEPLRQEMIAAGRELVELLDRNDFDVTCALWLFTSEANDWRLVLASPLVDLEGPKKVYGRIQTMLSMVPEEFASLSLRKISVTSPEDRFIKVLRSAIGTDRGIHDIRFSRSRINDVFVEDAYIYRAA